MAGQARTLLRCGGSENIILIFEALTSMHSLHSQGNRDCAWLHMSICR